MNKNHLYSLQLGKWLLVLTNQQTYEYKWSHVTHKVNNNINFLALRF